MQFICNLNHKFHYPAKLTQNTCTEHEFIEIQVCPFCYSKTFTEYIEPEADIISVKSVPLEEVDAHLQEGYKVRELYAKTATLVKSEAPKA